MTGVVTNPIVPINRDAEVSYMLNESRSKLMFVPGVFRKYDYVAMLKRIAPKLSSMPGIVTVRDASGSHADFDALLRSEEHTSELQSLMRISYAVFCLKNKKKEENNKLVT